MLENNASEIKLRVDNTYSDLFWKNVKDQNFSISAVVKEQQCKTSFHQ